MLFKLMPTGRNMNIDIYFLSLNPQNFVCTIKTKRPSLLRPLYSYILNHFLNLAFSEPLIGMSTNKTTFSPTGGVI